MIPIKPEDEAILAQVARDYGAVVCGIHRWVAIEANGIHATRVPTPAHYLARSGSAYMAEEPITPAFGDLSGLARFCREQTQSLGHASGSQPTVAPADRAPGL